MQPMTDQEFQELTRFIHSNYGIRLGAEKRTLVVGRLQHMVMQLGFERFHDYWSYVRGDASGQAMVALVDRITTNHTYFMREPAHFEFMKAQILPHLSRTLKELDLRIWSAGCSSGEEPYTLAMLLDEFFALDRAGWDLKVLATDLSSRILSTAQAGEYDEDQLAGLPGGWKSSYFKKKGLSRYIVQERLREQVIFRKFNLMEPRFPFKRPFHVIFCRNVMIYFDRDTRRELIRKFYEHTERGGYLFIGHSETIDRDESPYKYVMPAVYRKE